MLRRTKIIATLGPATDDPKVLDRLIDAGVDVVRLNLSYGTADTHRDRAHLVRERAHAQGRHVGILVDLQGPKIRIGRFSERSVSLQEGQKFILNVDMPLTEGNEERVGVTYKDLARDVARGDTLLLDDGRIALWVDEVQGADVICRVVSGGMLKSGN